MLALVCSDPPPGHARWTLRLLGSRMVELGYIDSISNVTVYERLKNELKPCQVKTSCIGKPSAQYVGRMEDVLDVYARRFDLNRLVVCLDEGAKELRSRPRGELPMEEGRPKHEDYEYERQGKANLSLSVEPLAGERRGRITERHTSLDLADELKCVVDEDYPEVQRIVLVMENLNTHGPACLYTRFEPQEARRIAAKLEWDYTPEMNENDEIVIEIGDGACTLALRFQGSLYTEYDDWVGLEWRAVKVSVAAALPSMTARVTRAIFLWELRKLHEGLARLSRELKGAASFQDIEEAIALNVAIDGIGHLQWDVRLSPSSHEDTLTIAGEQLVAELKAAWPKWNQSLCAYG